MTKQTDREIGTKLALKIVRLKHECGEKEYFKTMQALELAVKSIGWEIADKLKTKPMGEVK